MRVATATKPLQEPVASAADGERTAVEAKTEKRTLKVTYTRPWQYPAQNEAIFEPKDLHGNPARYSMIEASTKAGKTRGCIAWLAEQAIMGGKVGRNYWWIAPVQPQADIAYRRMKRALRGFLLKSNDSDRFLIVLNGATIWFKTGEKPDNLYGEDVYAVVIDEASRVRAEAWHAVRSTLTFTNGPVRCIGNVKGRKNWFYALARKAQHGEPGYSYHRMDAWDAVRAGIIKKEEVLDAKRSLPENVFNELYLCQPNEDGGNPFGLTHIAGCIAPMTDEMPFAMGVDFAKSVDWTVVHALDRAGNTCGFERWQGPWSLTTPRVKTLVGQVPTLADRTGVGDPIVEELQKANTSLEGFLFTPSSKQEIMVGLASAIQNREITFPPDVPGRPIVEELNSFEYEYTARGVRYTAPVGQHDDTVIALALAVEQRRRLNPKLTGVSPKGPVAASAWISEEATGEL